MESQRTCPIPEKEEAETNQPSTSRKKDNKMKSRFNLPTT
jgi:hypothetical protein